MASSDCFRHLILNCNKAVNGNNQITTSGIEKVCLQKPLGNQWLNEKLINICLLFLLVEGLMSQKLETNNCVQE